MKLAELFHSIQGEGKLTGVPSAFVRAAGCNLRCVWCDTPYASWAPQGQDVSIDQIVQQIKQHPVRHVVLTGGEPIIMPDIIPLCSALKREGYHITIETAGTLYKPIEVDLASLSPKLANSIPHHRDAGRFAPSHEKNRLNIPVLQQFIDAAPDFQLKFVLSSPADLPEIQSIISQLRGHSPADVLLMPEGIDRETLAERSSWLIDLCKQTGFRYCSRLHVELYGNKRGV